jgi:hypothetical protein
MTNRLPPPTGHDEGEEPTVALAKGRTHFQQLTTPRAASIAGILFSLLFSASVILLRTAMPQGAVAGTAWAHAGSGRINLALRLLPFAGIAFLWFIGVIRDRLGDYEDRFFSTVFFGSGLLFLAMVFVSAGVAAATLASGELTKTENSQVIYFGRVVMLQVSNVYAIRMAGVFMISLGTIWWRTGLMPRWLAVVSFLVALTLLVVINLSLWLVLLFPAWTFVVSVLVLVRNRPTAAKPSLSPT